LFFYKKNINFAQKYRIMVLDKDLYGEISEYCILNGIKTRDFIHEILREAFLIKKYGDTPFAFIGQQQKKDTQISEPGIQAIDISGNTTQEITKTVVAANDSDKTPKEPLIGEQHVVSVPEITIEKLNEQEIKISKPKKKRRLN
jgi:hypothetical protein